MSLPTREEKADRAGHAHRWEAGRYVGRGVVRAASPKQVALIKRLANERDVPPAGKTVEEARILERLLDTLGGWTPNLRLASDLIDYLQLLPAKAGAVANAATTKQVDFLTQLLTDRDCPADFAQRVRDKIANGITKPDASAAIDWLTQRPRVAQPEATTEPVTPGVYRVDGEVFIVKPNREKTRVYAKRLVELRDAQGDRLAETGDHVRVEFEYAPGAIRRIRPEHRMPVEEGKALTVRYGRCICCGRRLKVAESIERGIGPVCITYFAA